jgi:hypothetical protein
MDAYQLVGRQVYVCSAEFFGASAAAVIRATDPDSKSLLLEFLLPVVIGTQVYDFAVAHPRLQRDNLAVLLRKGVLGCAITCVPSERYDPASPFELGWWRGGGAVIADLVLCMGDREPASPRRIPAT